MAVKVRTPSEQREPTLAPDDPDDEPSRPTIEELFPSDKMLAIADQIVATTRPAGRDSELREDLIQETYKRMVRSWRNYDPARGRWAWARRIMVNAFYDEFAVRDNRETQLEMNLQKEEMAKVVRLSRRTSREEGDERPAAEPVYDEDPTGDFVLGIISEDWVREVLEDLPSQQARAIRLRYLKDRTYEEIASELGLTKGSVSKHLAEGLATLKDWVMLRELPVDDYETFTLQHQITHHELAIFVLRHRGKRHITRDEVCAQLEIAPGQLRRSEKALIHKLQAPILEESERRKRS